MEPIDVTRYEGHSQWPWCHDDDHDTDQANTRLISDAPKLLELCRAQHEMLIRLHRQAWRPADVRPDETLQDEWEAIIALLPDTQEEEA